jgi:hypothetical protein
MIFKFQFNFLKFVKKIKNYWNFNQVEQKHF